MFIFADHRKSVFKAKQHMIHLNLALALLLGMIVFVSGIETANGNKVSQTVLSDQACKNRAYLHKLQQFEFFGFVCDS